MSAPSKAQSGTKSDTLVRVKQSSSSAIVLRLWSQIVELLAPHSQLIRDIMASAHKDHHVARILDNFAATTLAKYFQSIVSFVQACHSLHIDLDHLTPVQLADGLLAMRLARSSDGIYLHGSTILKAIRWSVRHLGADCFQCSFDGLLSKFLTDKKAIDTKESLPLPLYSILHWEKKILTSSTSPLLTIILGAFLFQVWTGLRWSDMQRITPSQLVFDYKDIRGIAWRTKTTTKGQAFGCLASGFMSLSSHTWMLIFFRALDDVFATHVNSQLDFIIPRITMKGSLELVLPWNPCATQMRYTICERSFTSHGGLLVRVLSTQAIIRFTASRPPSYPGALRFLRFLKNNEDNRDTTGPSTNQYDCIHGMMCIPSYNCSRH